MICLEKDIFDREWDESQRLMLVELPITIQKIIKKAYPSIGSDCVLLDSLEERIKKIAITEIETAIATCKKKL